MVLRRHHAGAYADRDTVKGLLRNRFHVLKLYGALVIRPVLKMELRGSRARRQLHRFRKWLTREDLIVSGQQRQMLEDAIMDSSALKVVVEYKQRLKDLMRPSIQETDRLVRLQEWCANAEATGIEALNEFARQLRGYSMRSA